MSKVRTSLSKVGRIQETGLNNASRSSRTEAAFCLPFPRSASFPVATLSVSVYLPSSLASIRTRDIRYLLRRDNGGRAGLPPPAAALALTHTSSERERECESHSEALRTPSQPPSFPLPGASRAAPQKFSSSLPHFPFLSSLTPSLISHSKIRPYLPYNNIPQFLPSKVTWFNNQPNNVSRISLTSCLAWVFS